MKILFSIELLLVFIWEFLKANYSVFMHICRPSMVLKPAIFKLPIQLRSDFAIFLLTHMITLTPGTLSIQVSKDKDYILVHVLHSDNVADDIKIIKKVFELRLLRIFS